MGREKKPASQWMPANPLPGIPADLRGKRLRKRVRLTVSGPESYISPEVGMEASLPRGYEAINIASLPLRKMEWRPALLDEPEWKQWSDREIARQCRVDHKFVAKLRPPRLPLLPGISPVRKPHQHYQARHQGQDAEEEGQDGCCARAGIRAPAIRTSDGDHGAKKNRHREGCRLTR